jgi:bacillolysin
LKFSFVVSLLIIFSQGISAQSSGIKVSEPLNRFHKHYPDSGFELLQKGTLSQIYVEYNLLNTTPSIAAGGLTAPGYSSKSTTLQDVQRFFREYKELFGLQNPESELKELSSFQDDIGMMHIKLQQYINDIRIVSSEVVVHINQDGSIESVNGNYIPTPIIDIKPEVSSTEALSLARNYLGNYDPLEESTELILYRKDISLIPAYEVMLPSKDYPLMILYINASDGTLIYKDNGIRYDGPAAGYGVGLNGTTRQLNTYFISDKYYLIDASLPMFIPPVTNYNGVIITYDANNSLLGDGFRETVIVGDPNNDNVFDDTVTLRAAVDAHSYSQEVYNFYQHYFNRNSFDGRGKSLVNVVHYGQNYNNAFWNGHLSAYGDGDGELFSSFVALDVVCHEISHGVIFSTARLFYGSQSGALNESFADVFAVLLDSTNWLIGEDVTISGEGLRNFQDPNNGKQKGEKFWQPAHMNEFIVLPENEENDWGGVHINSGIPNKAFYNVAMSIGRWKAAQIWYRTLTAYLTSNSQFRDMRMCALLAANDLYGFNSAEYNAVANAFDAVGIYVNTPTMFILAYDDGIPDTGVYEDLPSWKLAYRFYSPAHTINIDEVAVYLAGDQNNGTGEFTLEIFDENDLRFPGNSLMTPLKYIPHKPYGWHTFNLDRINVSGNFYVSVQYDGINSPLIGADNPPGAGRSYKYNPSTNTWYKLTGDDDYILFMRARVSSVITSVETETLVPEEFMVSENFPNPFNPSTSIRYSLPNSEKVIIMVYDMTGRRIAELVNNFHDPGTYTISWNGKSDEGLNVSSGIYYCRIKAGDYSAIKKMVLIK